MLTACTSLLLHSSQDDYVDDVYSGSTYVNLEARVKLRDPEGIPIFLQVCWDGATMFRFVQGPSMYPLCYSIMNFPPSMRNKVNVGLHVASFCHGVDASQMVLAEELLFLFDEPIAVDGKRYYVVVAQIVMDGPGRTTYCKCRATTSHSGCVICDVDARSFGQSRRVYDSFRRYLPRNHVLRKKTSRSHVVRGDEETVPLEYAADERRPYPKNRCSMLLHMYCMCS